jgi:hypothetical protein
MMALQCDKKQLNLSAPNILHLASTFTKVEHRRRMKTTQMDSPKEIPASNKMMEL